jgi:5,10-methylene-tetrahydrofolate dehydrogenase/methenyl tetrahydrofolate cyclohydrolase
MAVFSPRLLDEPNTVSQELRRKGCEQLVVYVTQQIQQFRLQGETFAMQHLESTSDMERIYNALFSSLTEEEIAKLLAKLPLKKRLEGVSREQLVETLSPEERLEGLSPEERLEGLSPEERLEGLSPEERERLIELLQQEAKKKPKRRKKG